MTKRLILASRSPRRRQLIRLLGLPCQAMAADVDERVIDHPDPAVNVVQTAQLKAAEIRAQLGQTSGPNRPIVVAADTTVSLDGQILGKPVDERDARRMLLALRDRVHQVHTGLTLVDLATGRQVSGVQTAEVRMRRYSEEEISTYIATGDPMDKAGAYAIQHPQFRPVAELDGCYTGVMGLSICHLIQTLLSLEVPVPTDMAAIYQSHNGYYCPLFEALRAAGGSLL